MVTSAESRLRHALDMAGVGMCSWALDSGTGELDARAADILGLAPGQNDALWEALLARVHPSDRVSLQDRLANVVTRQDAFSLQFRVVGDDGRMCHVALAVRISTTEPGVPGELVGIVRNVTAEHEAAAALGEAEAKYRALFESIDEGYFLVEVIQDEDGRAVDVRYLDSNRAAERLVGVDVVGGTLREVNPSLAGVWSDLLERVARTGTSERFERPSSLHDRWYDFFVARVGDGSSRRVAVVFRDITDRKRRDANAEFNQRMPEDFSEQEAPDEIIQSIGEKLGAHLGLAAFTFVDVDESQEEELQVTHYWSLPGVPRLHGRLRIRDFATEEFIQSCRAGKTWVVRDTEDDPRTDGEALGSQSIGAFVTVPFHRDGEWRAFLAVTDKGPRHWRDDEIELIEGVAGRLFPRIERARAHQALLASHEELQLIADNVPALIGSVDAAGRYRFVNDAVCQFVRRSRADLIGMSFKEAVGERAYARLRPGIETALRTGQTVIFDDAEPDKHGPGFHGVTEEHFIPRLSEDGTADGYYFLALDVSESRRVKEELRGSRDDSERRQRIHETVAGNTPDLIFVVGLDHRFTYANAALLAAWGRTWEEAIGKSLAELGRDPHVAARLEMGLDEIAATKQPMRTEIEIPHAALGRRVYQYISLPVLNEVGEVEAVTGTGRDITELKELHRQKDEFIGIVSHELRTPVTSVKAYAQILQRRFRNAGNSDSAAMMVKMDAQLNRLASLIGDLLDVTKIEAGQLRLQEALYDFDALVDEAVEEMQRTADRHRLVRQGRTGAQVWGDRERIGQVLTNLLSNAIKYSPHADSVLVHSSFKGGQVTLGVQDFGIGIDEQDREQVFERFYRVRGPDRETYAGIGLGLYIASEIVHRQGGRIWVESQQENGSTFCFTLPADREPMITNDETMGAIDIEPGQ